MKFSDIWPELVGQDANIVVPRVLVRVTGSLTSAAVLADLVWWQGVKGDWFYRTDADISKRQGVTIYGVAKSRDALKAAGLVETRFEGHPPKMRYMVNLEAVGQLIASSGPSLRNQRDGSNSAKSKRYLRDSAELSYKGNTKAPVTPGGDDAGLALAAKWSPVLRKLSDILGGVRVVNARTGRPLAKAGQALAMIGKASNDDVELSVAMLVEFAASREFNYFSLSENGLSWLGKWLASSYAATMASAPAAAPPATYGDASWFAGRRDAA